MLEALRAKFRIPSLAYSLLDTQGYLEETNIWGDTYWGGGV